MATHHLGPFKCEQVLGKIYYKQIVVDLKGYFFFFKKTRLVVPSLFYGEKKSIYSKKMQKFVHYALT
jgi:hypothetical protein